MIPNTYFLMRGTATGPLSCFAQPFRMAFDCMQCVPLEESRELWDAVRTCSCRELEKLADHGQRIFYTGFGGDVDCGPMNTPVTLNS